MFDQPFGPDGYARLPLAALVVAVLVGLWTDGVLTFPLRRLSLATAQVAGGDFESKEDLP